MAKKKVKTVQKKKSNVSSQKKDNTLPILTHLLGLLTGFLGPLIILLAVKEEYVKKHAKKALNWQISLVIYALASFVLIFIFVGIFTMFVVSILNLIFCIIAAVKAGNNELWDYPLTIPFLK